MKAPALLLALLVPGLARAGGRHAVFGNFDVDLTYVIRPGGD